MPVTLSRTYPDAIAQRLAPAVLAYAEEIEGHPKVQGWLEAAGVPVGEGPNQHTTRHFPEGIRRIQDAPPKVQAQLVIDYMLLELLRQYEARRAQAAAAQAALEAATNDFEGGGE